MNLMRTAVAVSVLSSTFLLFGVRTVGAESSLSQSVVGPQYSSTETPSAAAQDLAVLRAQLETMRSFTDGLLATVHWSLGAVVVVASLLVGFGWFNSARLHDRDIQAVRSEVAALVSAQGATLRTDIERTMKEGVSEVASSADDAARRVVTSIVSPLKKDAQDHAKALAKLRVEFYYAKHRAEARYWEWQGVKGNEVTQYVEMLGLALRQEDAFEISVATKGIDVLLPEVDDLHSSTVTELVSLLDRMPPEYSIQAERIRANLRRIRTL